MSAASRRRGRATAVWFLQLAASGIALWLFEPDDRLLAAPMLAILLAATLYMMVLWARDGVPPVFEAGTLCTLAIAAYGALPLVGFLLMNGQWDRFSDGRLQAYPFVVSDLGMFGWRYALYAFSFVIAYLVVRGRAGVRSRHFDFPKPSTQAAVIIVFVLLYGCKIALKIAYGYDPDDFTYSDVAGSVARSLATNMPYSVLQFAHNVPGLFFAASLGVMVLLMASWRRWWCRWVLFAWLIYEAASTAIRLGSRGRVVLLLLSAGVLYHRLVRPMRFRQLIAAGTLLLTGFLVLGAVRVVSSSEAMKERAGRTLTAGNEFQGLFTTAYDIHQRRAAGSIRSVPWQVYVSDLYFNVPSQLLPFEKIDPASWYIDLLGQTGQGMGYMFGVMAQAAIGLDWIEVAVRGVVLAVALALLQRWYAQRAARFWPTLFCLFTALWTYYTMRASTFYFVYFVVYHFLPVMLATRVLTRAMSRLEPRRTGQRMAATA